MDDALFVAGDENQVARLRLQPFGDGDELIDGEEFGDGAAHLARVGLDGQPGQRLGSLAAGHLFQFL